MEWIFLEVTIVNKNKIFIATPISGFQNENQYKIYRKKVNQLIESLSKRYEVYSEIQSITGSEVYDSPEDSLKKDFKAINKSNIFILLHPMRIQSSTLIELGYACALKKTLVIVGEEKDLPYLALGLAKSNDNAYFISSSVIDDEIVVKINDILNSLNKGTM